MNLWKDTMKDSKIVEIGIIHGIPARELGKYCQAGSDGECNWKYCPQNRDDEPKKTGRHCSLDICQDELGRQ